MEHAIALLGFLALCALVFAFAHWLLLAGVIIALPIWYLAHPEQWPYVVAAAALLAWWLYRAFR
jgi:hypothetical protein